MGSAHLTEFPPSWSCFFSMNNEVFGLWELWRLLKLLRFDGSMAKAINLKAVKSPDDVLSFEWLVSRNRNQSSTWNATKNHSQRRRKNIGVDSFLSWASSYSYSYMKIDFVTMPTSSTAAILESLIMPRWWLVIPDNLDLVIQFGIPWYDELEKILSELCLKVFQCLSYHISIKIFTK